MTRAGTHERVRVAGPADARRVAELLHRFNTEFRWPAPGADVLAARVRQLMESGDLTAILAGAEASGLAVLRFRPALWKEALDAYLEELYVVPERRRQGLGRALMLAAIELARDRGAGDMHVGTSEADLAARGLYESFGFDNHEGGPNGPVQYFYEREL
jgi:GNAT superfamily N-acetyltransferase